MKILVVLSFIGLAFPLGLVAPDVDQKISFLVHRSIFTHAPWLALLATFWALKSKSRWAVPCICAAFTCGLVVHFAADLFPKAWMGFALVHIPVVGRLSPTASVCWLLSSLAISVACALYSGWLALPKDD